MAESDIDEKIVQRHRRALVLVGCTLAVVVIAAVIGLSIDERTRATQTHVLVDYAPGLAATEWSTSDLKGGCELVVGYLENTGGEPVVVQRASVAMVGLLRVRGIQLVPADPQ